MALISCSECGKQISNTSPQCPACGYRIRRSFVWYKNGAIYESVGASVTILSMIGGLFMGIEFLGVFFIPGLIIFIVGRILPR